MPPTLPTNPLNTKPIPTILLLSSNTASNIITMQQNIINNLQNLVSSETIINEGFENVNEGTIRLNPASYPNISDYANVYNQNVALLDDPSNMINASFNTYINIQNKKIKNLRSQLNTLQTDIQSNKVSLRGIKGFKSMNNSQIMNAEGYNGPKYNPVYNTESTNPTNTNPINYNVQVNNASKYPNYLIYGNNGCLQYEQSTYTLDAYGNTKTIPATWGFKSCNANEPRQQFVSTQVNDKDTYNSFIKDPSNLTSQIKSLNTTQFGFHVVNPINNQDQCLQLNNDGLSVMPCSLDFDQRFRPIYSSIMP